MIRSDNKRDLNTFKNKKKKQQIDFKVDTIQTQIQTQTHTFTHTLFTFLLACPYTLSLFIIRDRNKQSDHCWQRRERVERVSYDTTIALWQQSLRVERERQFVATLLPFLYSTLSGNYLFHLRIATINDHKIQNNTILLEFLTQKGFKSEETSLTCKQILLVTINCEFEQFRFILISPRLNRFR